MCITMGAFCSKLCYDPAGSHHNNSYPPPRYIPPAPNLTSPSGYYGQPNPNPGPPPPGMVVPPPYPQVPQNSGPPLGGNYNYTSGHPAQYPPGAGYPYGNPGYPQTYPHPGYSQNQFNPGAYPVNAIPYPGRQDSKMKTALKYGLPIVGAGVGAYVLSNALEGAIHPFSRSSSCSSHSGWSGSDSD